VGGSNGGRNRKSVKLPTPLGFVGWNGDKRSNTLQGQGKKGFCGGGGEKPGVSGPTHHGGGGKLGDTRRRGCLLCLFCYPKKKKDRKKTFFPKGHRRENKCRGQKRKRKQPTKPTDRGLGGSVGFGVERSPQTPLGKDRLKKSF